MRCTIILGVFVGQVAERFSKISASRVQQHTKTQASCSMCTYNQSTDTCQPSKYHREDTTWLEGKCAVYNTNRTTVETCPCPFKSESIRKKALNVRLTHDSRAHTRHGIRIISYNSQLHSCRLLLISTPIKATQPARYLHAPPGIKDCRKP